MSASLSPSPVKEKTEVGEVNGNQPMTDPPMTDELKEMPVHFEDADTQNLDLKGEANHRNDAQLPAQAPNQRPRTPQSQDQRQRNSHHVAAIQTSPSTPGHLASFDWDDFHLRYQKALEEATAQEKQLLQQFDELVKVSTLFRTSF